MLVTALENGKITVTESLSTDSFEKYLIKAFPNPTNDIVTVIIPKEYVLEKIEMYNSLDNLWTVY
jgi:hypothetical protein